MSKVNRVAVITVTEHWDQGVCTHHADIVIVENGYPRKEHEWYHDMDPATLEALMGFYKLWCGAIQVVAKPPVNHDRQSHGNGITATT